MLNRLKFFLKRVIFYKRINLVKKHVNIGTNTKIDLTKIILRHPIPGKVYLVVGSDCLINSVFVFEKDSGKIHIGNRTFIGPSMFVCIDQISIGHDVMISWGCTIVDNNAHSISSKQRAQDVTEWKKGVDEGHVGKYKNWEFVDHAPVRISDKAWIGFNSIIMKGITVGEAGIVGSGSVVTKNVKPYTAVGGNPSMFIKEVE